MSREIGSIICFAHVSICIDLAALFITNGLIEVVKSFTNYIHMYVLIMGFPCGLMCSLLGQHGLPDTIKEKNLCFFSLAMFSRWRAICSLGKKS